jgi:lytic cellulose monooxygenase (C1-hydroxylating)
MHFSALFLASVVTLAQQVAAHGYVPQLKIGSQYIAGWDVASDPYKTPRVSP